MPGTDGAETDAPAAPETCTPTARMEVNVGVYRADLPSVVAE